jgi:hypothetical protein
MPDLENKTIKKKKLDKELNLKVLKNEASQRIFVEFTSESGKLSLQKSFQDTFDGRQAAEDFQQSIKTINDLKRYFGVK